MDDRHCRCLPKVSQKHNLKKKQNGNNNSPWGGLFLLLLLLSLYSALTRLLVHSTGDSSATEIKGEVCLSRDSQSFQFWLQC